MRENEGEGVVGVPERDVERVKQMNISYRSKTIQLLLSIIHKFIVQRKSMAKNLNFKSSLMTRSVAPNSASNT